MFGIGTRTMPTLAFVGCVPRRNMAQSDIFDRYNKKHKKKKQIISSCKRRCNVSRILRREMIKIVLGSGLRSFFRIPNYTKNVDDIFLSYT